MNLAEYAEHDALGLAGLVRRGEVTPVELVKLCLEATERVNPTINAVCQTFADQALATARETLPAGPFRGVPFLLKDVALAMAGTRTGSGSRLLLGSPAASHDSELVARYRRAGLIIVGKTTTPEFGASATTEVDLTGVTRNPWHLEHSSGGSSGGAAAATAAGIVPAAQGGDGGGSLRIPAACCGLFGLKPTRQRLPTGPDAGDLFYGFAVHHALTRSVRDSAALLDATCGPDVGAPYWAPPPGRSYLAEVGADPGRLRIAVAEQAFAGDAVDPACAAAVRRAAALCADLGHSVQEDRPSYDRDAFMEAIRTYLFSGIAFGVEKVAADLGKVLDASAVERLTWLLIEDGRRYSARDFIAAGHYLGALTRNLGRFFERYDVLLTPSLARPPVPLGYLKNDHDSVEDYLHKTMAYLPFQPLFNATGQPAANVPFDISAGGLPIGVQIAARFGDEATLIRLAAQLEQARPWAHHRPPCHVSASPGAAAGG